MGSYSFVLPNTLPADARRCLDRACLAGGYDLAPVATRSLIADNLLSLSKDGSESGCLMSAWPVAGVGCPVFQSATLRERPEPYHFMTELIRGKLNQVRVHAAEWEAIGLALDPDIRSAIGDLTRRFGRLATGTGDLEADMDGLITEVHHLAGRITHQFVEQLLNTRLEEGGRLETAIGCLLSEVPAADDQAVFAEHFGAVRLVPDWRTIEPFEAEYAWEQFDAVVDWAVRSDLAVSIGPLVDLAHGPFPDWLAQWAGDLPSLAAFTCDFVETVIRRYQDKVRVWQVFAGFNHADGLGLGEDDRLRLAARLLEAARQTSAEGEWVIGVAQPWGDYLASNGQSYSPIIFVDTLLRAGFTLAGVELEVLSGPGTRASAPRDLLDVYRILDLFGVLGLPLEVACAATGSKDLPDTAAADWAADVLSLAVALPHVRSVIWDGWTGPRTGRVPGSELGGSKGLNGPVGTAIRDLREIYLA